MSEAKGLSRQQMCDRLAMEFEDGWVVNLGLGIPTLCSNCAFGDREIVFHSENGVIGYGPLAKPGAEDLHLTNAGGQLKLLNLNKRVKDLLQITKLYTVFEVFDDEAAAVRSFS